MNNVIQRGGRCAYANTSGSTKTAGRPIVVVNSTTTGWLVIPFNDIADQTSGEVVTGVTDETIVLLAKKSGDVFTFGQIVYWDDANARLTTTSSGNCIAGRADAAYASAATSAGLMLNRR